jgi:hypothetical protein
MPPIFYSTAFCDWRAFSVLRTCFIEGGCYQTNLMVRQGQTKISYWLKAGGFYGFLWAYSPNAGSYSTITSVP